MTSQRFTAVLFSLALVLGLLSALDVVSPDLGTSSSLRTAEAARSGAWTCPAQGLAAGEAIDLVASSAPGGLEPPAADDGDVEAVEPAGGAGVATEVTYDRFGQGDTQRVGRSSPFPEQAADVTVGHPTFPVARAEFGVSARWRRQPAAVARIWQRSTEFGPAGLLSAPCIPGSSSTWVLPGLSTAGGAEASLVLANPFRSDASVTVTLAGPDGPQAPALLENVVVPAESVRMVLLNEHAPEQRDVGVVVRTRSGRVVVEGLQSINAAIGGIEGVAIVPAAPGGASTWTIPWVPTTPSSDPALAAVEGDEASDDEDDADDEGDAVGDPLAPAGRARPTIDEGIDGTASSWLWVTNVGDDDALLLVTAHGPSGGELVDLGGDLLLAPGAVRRIDLDGTLTSRRSAITVATENGVPVAASIGTQVADDDEDRTGIAVQLGASAVDDVWVLPGAGPEGRDATVALVNPSGESATVALSAWTSTGIVRPEGGQTIEVPAGTVRFVDVTDVLDVQLPSSVVFVQAVTGQVVAGRIDFARDDRLDLVATVGIPSAVWRGGTLVPTTRFDPSLTGEVVPSESEGEEP